MASQLHTERMMGAEVGTAQVTIEKRLGCRCQLASVANTFWTGNVAERTSLL
jgi:hypothetical protein